MPRHISTSGTAEILVKLAFSEPTEKFVFSMPTKDRTKLNISETLILRQNPSDKIQATPYFYFRHRPNPKLCKFEED